MKLSLILAAGLTFAVHAHADTLKLNCVAKSSHTEMDEDDLKDKGNVDLRKFLAAKSATISISDTTATLAIKGSVQGKLEAYSNKNLKSRGLVGYSNDKLALVDDSYGAHFSIFAKAADLKAIEKGDKKSVNVRAWTAAVSEPDDDSGKQVLFNNSNLNLSCTLAK